MASRALVGKAQTASLSLYLPFGTRWEILRVTLVLKASSTAGSRRLFARWTDNIISDPDGSYGAMLADTGAQTTVSTNYAAVGTGSASGAQAIGYTIYYSKLVLGQMDQIDISATLVTGDTFDYYVEVNEVPDL